MRGLFFCTVNFFPIDSGHGAARFGAALAVLHIMRGTLLGAPVTNLGAQRADFLREWTVARHSIRTQTTQSCAINTAGRAGVCTFLAGHVAEATGAFSCAVVTGGYAVSDCLCEVMTHVDTQRLCTPAIQACMFQAIAQSAHSSINAAHASRSASLYDHATMH